MKKSTKGALAAATAALLLVGGAGSLAFWTESATVAGPGALTAGELTLTPTGSCADGTPDWLFDSAETEADKPYVAGDLLVPGDALRTTCTYTLLATGEHMEATFAVTDPTAGSGALAPALTVTSTVTVDGAAPPATFTEGEYDVEATINVVFNAATTDLENATTTLNGLTLTVTQAHG